MNKCLRMIAYTRETATEILWILKGGRNIDTQAPSLVEKQTISLWDLNPSSFSWVCHFPYLSPVCPDFLSRLKWNILNVSTSHTVYGSHGTWVGNFCVLGIFGKLTLGLFSTGNGKLLNLLLILQQSAYFCALVCCRLCGMPEMQMSPPALPGKDTYPIPTPLCLVLISLSCCIKTKGLGYAEVLPRRDNVWGCVIFKWPFCHVEFMKSGILWTSATFFNHSSIITVIHQVPTLLPRTSNVQTHEDANEALIFYRW